MNSKFIILGVALIAIAGCQAPSARNEQAKTGAKYGAVSGAVSGFFWGLFSGDPLEQAAEGAIVGAGTGATMGALKGGQKDKKLKDKYGETNFDALMQLVRKNYPAAKKLATKEEKSSNIEYRKAALWLLVLIEKETGNSDSVLEQKYKQLIAIDPSIKTLRSAEARANKALGKLEVLRNK